MKTKVLIFIAATASMMLGFWASSKLQLGNTDAITSQVMPFQGTVLSTPRKLAIPDLIKDDGSVFSATDLQDHWTLVFYGYTHCPDVCPTTMNVLAQAKKKSPVDFPEVIFISVDPERDTVDTLGEYVQYFDPSFKGVTGDGKRIEALALQMGSVFMKAPGQDDENYIMDHSSSIIVLNPRGNLAAFISAPHTPENILKALRAIQE